MTKLWPLLYHSPNTTGRLWWCLLCDHLRAIRRAHITSQSSFRQALTKYNFEILSILLSIKFTKLDKFYQYWHPWTYWQWDKDIWSPISLMYVIFIIVNWRWSLVYMPIRQLTTPGERTKMSGVRVVESSTTCCMSSTGGSTNFDPRLFIMKDVTQKDTRSGRRDRTINIFWSSLQALSHSPEKNKRSGKESEDSSIHNGEEAPWIGMANQRVAEVSWSGDSLAMTFKLGSNKHTRHVGRWGALIACWAELSWAEFIP